MPVIHIRALPSERPVDAVLASIAEAIGERLDIEVGDTWCTFTPLQAQSIGAQRVRGEGQIVYAQVFARSRGTEVDLVLLDTVGRALAEGFGVPVEDVWVSLHPVAPGQVFAGGSIIGG